MEPEGNPRSHGRNTKRARSIPRDIASVAHRKLDYVDAATSLEDLKVPPGNRLELLKGDLAGKYSIRINQQWRVVFRWEDGAAHEVKSKTTSRNTFGLGGHYTND